MRCSPTRRPSATTRCSCSAISSATAPTRRRSSSAPSRSTRTRSSAATTTRSPPASSRRRSSTRSRATRSSGRRACSPPPSSSTSPSCPKGPKLVSAGGRDLPRHAVRRGSLRVRRRRRRARDPGGVGADLPLRPHARAGGVRLVGAARARAAGSRRRRDRAAGDGVGADQRGVGRSAARWRLARRVRRAGSRSPHDSPAPRHLRHRRAHRPAFSRRDCRTGSRNG